MKLMKLMYIALLAMVMMYGKAVAANRVAVKKHHRRSCCFSRR